MVLSKFIGLVCKKSHESLSAETCFDIFSLMSCSSHIQSVLIGVKYWNYYGSLDVYLGIYTSNMRWTGHEPLKFRLSSCGWLLKNSYLIA